MEIKKEEFSRLQGRSCREYRINERQVCAGVSPTTRPQSCLRRRWIPCSCFKGSRLIEWILKRVLKPILSRNVSVWSRIKKFQRYIANGYLAPITVCENGKTLIYEEPNGDCKPFGVNLAGYLRSEKGVGEAGRAAGRALEAASIPYVVNEVVDSGSINTDAATVNFAPENPYAINLVHINADRIPDFVSKMGGSYFKGRYNIGCWFWELSQFPEEWYPSFQFFNELWAPTTFIHDALSRISPIPVVKMPLALSPKLEVVQGLTRADFGLPTDSFVFLFILDFASVLERKNPFGLIQAFKLAFGNKDDAILVLKVAHSEQYPSEAKTLKRACAANNVYIIDRILSRPQLNTLLSLCDCYASLHRSEGYGLPIAEVMTLGKPVIVTAYSGNMDFTTPANSFLVKYQLTEIDRDYGPYRKGLVWADPDLNHAAELMEYVFKNGARAQDIGQRGQRDLMELFHPSVVGQQIKEHLRRVISETGAFSLSSRSKKSFSSLP